MTDRLETKEEHANMSEAGWKTIGVTALAPAAAHEMAALDSAVAHSWYWVFEEMLASTARDGRGELYEFVPIALLYQERTLADGVNVPAVRIVPGKLTLMGTVVPVDDDEPKRPSAHEEEQWTTISVSYLPDGIRELSATKGLSTRSNSLLLQRQNDGSLTRVKLGRFDLGNIVPVSNYTRGFDLGPWAVAHKS